MVYLRFYGLYVTAEYMKRKNIKAVYISIRPKLSWINDDSTWLNTPLLTIESYINSAQTITDIINIIPNVINKNIIHNPHKCLTES